MAREPAEPPRRPGLPIDRPFAVSACTGGHSGPSNRHPRIALTLRRTVSALTLTGMGMTAALLAAGVPWPVAVLTGWLTPAVGVLALLLLPERNPSEAGVADGVPERVGPAGSRSRLAVRVPRARVPRQRSS